MKRVILEITSLEEVTGPLFSEGYFVSNIFSFLLNHALIGVFTYSVIYFKIK